MDQIWETIVSQIPVVALFAIIELKILDIFFKHLEDQEKRAAENLKEQRTANDKALETLTTATTAAMGRMTDELCREMSAVVQGYNAVRDDVGDLARFQAAHDTYVRTVHRERYSPKAVREAEAAAMVAGREGSGGRNE